MTNTARADTATTTTITATPYFSTLGSPVTLRATVGPGAVFGGVVFYVDNQYYQATGLAGGVGTVTVTVSTAGIHSARASYIGVPGFYLPSSCINVGFSVSPSSPVTTTTSLSFSSSPACPTAPFNVIASISPSDAVGTVQFKKDGVNVGSPVAVVNGSASKAFTISTPGSPTFQAVFSGQSGFLGSTSPQVSQTVNGFVTQPADAVACPGSTATFTAIVSDPNVWAYQWQVSTDGGQTFQNVPEAFAPNQTTYTTQPLTAADNNKRYRCWVNPASACYGYSRVATLTTVDPTLASFVSEATTPQPTSFIISGATFGEANGHYVQSTPNLYNNQDASTAMEFTAGNWIIHRVPNNGPSDLLYQAQSGAIIGAWVPLQANDTSSPVVTQPVLTVCPNDQVTLSVAANNAVQYQWEESFNDGVTWLLPSLIFSDPGTSATFTTDPLDPVRDYIQFHCVIFNDTCETTTNPPVTVRIAETRVIAWTGNKKVTKGGTLRFSVAAVGADLTYQWRANSANITDNGHYSGTQTALLTINNVGDDDLVGYDCVVTGRCGPDTSDQVTMTFATPSDGDSKWSLNTRPTLFNDTGLVGLDGSPAVSSDGTTIYFIASKEKVLHAINTDGTEKWFTVLRTGGFDDTTTPAVGADGTVYVGMADRLAAFNPSNGTEKWHTQFYPLSGHDPSSPAIYTDPITSREIIFLSSDNAENISAFLTDGSRLPPPQPDATGWWPVSNGQEPEPSCTVGPNGTVFCPFDDGSVVAYAQDATTLWGKGNGFDPFSGWFTVAETHTPELTPDLTGRVYIGSSDSLDSMAWAYALDATTGEEKWHLQLPTGSRSILSSACVYNDLVYFTTTGSPQLVAADAATGIPRWTFSVASGDVGSWSSPAVTSDGTVIFGSWDHNLYAVSPPASGVGAGTMLWSFTGAGGEIVSSPVIAPSDNTIYVGSADGNLYAIKNSKPLANSPWPMYRKNPRRTGSY
jgi:outer membrane protein assembly factor BamB